MFRNCILIGNMKMAYAVSIVATIFFVAHVKGTYARAISN